MRLTVELTHRCNFACPHCYCRIAPDSPRRLEEQSGKEWTRIIDEAAAEGAFFILFTGGEPLLHPEFRTIWVAAKRAGLIPELFTNGSLITEEMADFLAEWPPQQVSVTLYGSDAETYATMTGGRGTLSKVLNGLDLLLARQIKVEVKGLLTRLNSHDFDRLRELCARYQENFIWSAELAGPTPGSDGEPRGVALTAAEVVALEQRDPVRWNEWVKVLSSWQAAETKCDDRLFRCNAGKSECHVDPYGRLSPCLMLDTIGYDVRNGQLREGWRHTPELLSSITWKPGSCQRCTLGEVCRICPAVAIRQGAPAAGPTALHCALGKTRTELFGIPARPAALMNQEEAR